MENNKITPKGHFVFFGPANVGKSTMIGYILSHEWTKEQFITETKKVQERVGDSYQKRRLYSYFVDKSKDEYRKNEGLGSTFGTSKYVHIKDVGEFVLVDTPGGSDYSSERYKGLSLANVGIFAIEIQQLLELHNTILNERVEKYLKTVREFFSSWFLWKKLHGISNTIVLLTKYDLSAGEDNYAKAISVLSDIIKEDINNISIIPTSINVYERSDVNVFTLLESRWYKGKTLIQAIKEKNNSIKSNHSPHDHRLLMFYNREFKRVQGIGRIIKWKVSSGSINVNDKIVIAPILIDNKWSKVIASIKSMHNEKREDISFADTGEIVNIALSNISYENKAISKDRIDISNTTIITSSTDNLKMGNTIIGIVDLNNCTEEERVALSGTKSKERVNLLWFGKMLAPNVIAYEKDQKENKCLLRLRLKNKNVALPCDFFPKKILLQLLPKDELNLPINYDFMVEDIQYQLDENY